MRFPIPLFLIALVTCALSQGIQGSSDPKVIKGLEKEWGVAQVGFAKHPRDAKARERFIVAGVRFGHESMVSPVLPPKVKYRQAVLVYRKVLKVDPKNPIARPEYDMMIKIYKQMGRPIPE